MAEDERSTGTPNTIYNLTSVLFHALEGGANYDTYIQDAEREGDQELVEFFRLVRDEDSERADRAQELLVQRSSIGGTRMGGTVSDLPGTEPSGVSRTEGVTTGITTGAAGGAATSGVGSTAEDIPPRVEEAPPRMGGATSDIPPTEDVPPRVGDAPPRMEEDVPPRPGEAPPGMEGDPLRDEPRAGEPPEVPGGLPPDRPTGEVPPGAARETEVPSGTPPQAPPGDVQRERRPEGEREEDKGLIDRAIDKLTGEDEEERRRREGPDRPEGR